jgi:hypothetical protein
LAASGSWEVALTKIGVLLSTIVGLTGVAFLVTRIAGGNAGTRKLRRHFNKFRVGPNWYLLALFRAAILVLHPVGAYVVARHLVFDAFHACAGQYGPDERDFALARSAVARGDVEDRAVVLDHHPRPVAARLALGHVAILIEDLRQLRDAVRERKGFEPDQRPPHPILASLVEHALYQVGVVLLNDPEQLVSELTISLRPEHFGGWRQAVPPPGPTGSWTFVAVSYQAIGLQSGELLPDRAQGDPDRARDLGRRGFTRPLDGLEDASSGLTERVQTDR